MNKPKFVFDTNAFISALLLESSISAKAIDKAFKIGDVVVSTETFAELQRVLFRSKFDKYLTSERRIQAISKLERDTVLYPVDTRITACRDPKDDKYLELAIASKAVCIVSGDKDLQVLNPFLGIAIMSATEFMKMVF